MRSFFVRRTGWGGARWGVCCDVLCVCFGGRSSLVNRCSCCIFSTVDVNVNVDSLTPPFFPQSDGCWLMT